jgi:hypothetical protein
MFRIGLGIPSVVTPRGLSLSSFTHPILGRLSSGLVASHKRADNNIARVLPPCATSFPALIGNFRIGLQKKSRYLQFRSGNISIATPFPGALQILWCSHRSKPKRTLWYCRVGGEFGCHDSVLSPQSTAGKEMPCFSFLTPMSCKNTLWESICCNGKSTVNIYIEV